MFKKDGYIGEPSTSCGFNLQRDQNFFSDMHSSHNQYDCLDKLDNEVKTSRYFPRTDARTNYSSDPKNNFKIRTCSHFQDLNEKFQELESKMFEVEECFKEANKREMNEVQRMMDRNSISTSNHMLRSSRLFEVADNKKQNACPPGFKQWLGNDNFIAKEKNAFENRMDGGGDAPPLPNEASFQDSCKTIIKSMEKSPVHLSNAHCPKYSFTIPKVDGEQQNQLSKHLNFDESNKSTEVDFLERSKKLILTLIDKELKRIEAESNDHLQSKLNQATRQFDKPRDNNNTKNLKIECIQNIERELNALKKLESFEQ